MSFPIKTEMSNATSAKKAADGGEKNALLNDFNKPNKSRFFSQGKNSGLPALLSPPLTSVDHGQDPVLWLKERFFHGIGGPRHGQAAGKAGKRKNHRKRIVSQCVLCYKS